MPRQAAERSGRWFNRRSGVEIEKKPKEKGGAAPVKPRREQGGRGRASDDAETAVRVPPLTSGRIHWRGEGGAIDLHWAGIEPALLDPFYPADFDWQSRGDPSGRGAIDRAKEIF